jgi:hypothetical protein
MDVIAKFETLDTGYVNLSALIHYLRERKFTGRLRVSLDEYEADIFLYGSSPPSVWESNRASGLEAPGDAAMERLLVRAREPGGSITVYENAEMKSAPSHRNGSSSPVGAASETPKPEPVADQMDSESLLLPSADLIGAVERAVDSIGGKFADIFHAVRVEMGDDYPFLDPTLDGFEYPNGAVELKARPSRTVYLDAVTECLRRVINKAATTSQGARLRERVAVEFAIAVRRSSNAFGEFSSRLDQIAGTRVL